MSTRDSQGWYVTGGATVLLPPRMRLAPSERERLWKGLERFANCRDDLGEFQALGRAFPDFWPTDVCHFPNQETDQPVRTGALVLRVGESCQSIAPPSVPRRKRVITDWELTSKTERTSDGEFDELSDLENVNWHPVCHRLFLVYRDGLREVWNRGKPSLWCYREEFLLGLTDYNDEAHKAAKGTGPISLGLLWPLSLEFAWQDILEEFPTAFPESRVNVVMIWERGDFELVPKNDFQRAFYLLFRQSWRARVCPRCKMFFVARRPKQSFCGTACSGGSRLASKRKWWERVGAKRRAVRDKLHSKQKRSERKQR